PRVMVRLQAPELKEVDLYGTGNFTVTNTLHSEKVEFRIAGGGDIRNFGEVFDFPIEKWGFE
ncbi:MAG: hypothetical protein AAFR39_08690, partial [Pseudomonadota bacterium]